MKGQKSHGNLYSPSSNGNATRSKGKKESPTGGKVVMIQGKRTEQPLGEETMATLLENDQGSLPWSGPCNPMSTKKICSLP